jgi:hypothetical protein
MRRHWKTFAATAAIALGALLAFTLPAGAALSVQSQSPPNATVELGRTATLQANGAAVFTAVNVVCAPGQYTSLEVIVTEAVRNTIASGRTVRQIYDCTGKPQKLTIAVTPTQRPFVRGVAFGQAAVESCYDRCQVARDEHTIRIV